MYLVYLLGVTVLDCIILLNTQHLAQWITNVSQTEFIDSLVLLFSCVRICSLSSLVLFFFFLSTMVPRMSINGILTSQNSLHYMVCKCKPSLWGQTVTHLSHRRLSDSQLQPEGPVETSAQPGVRPVGFCRPRKTPTIKINDC